MLLYRPDVAAVPCSECQAWLYDEKWQKVTRGGQPVPRPAGAITPCWKCPKQSPEKAKHHELTEKNWKTYQLYLEAQASGGLPAGWEGDAVLRRNFGVIESVFRGHERDRAESLAALATLVRSFSPSPAGPGRPGRR